MLIFYSPPKYGPVFNLNVSAGENLQESGKSIRIISMVHIAIVIMIIICATFVIWMVILMNMMMTMMTMVTQHIPTSHNPTKWESVIMMKGGNLTQSISHPTYI